MIYTLDLNQEYYVYTVYYLNYSRKKLSNDMHLEKQVDNDFKSVTFQMNLTKEN